MYKYEAYLFNNHLKDKKGNPSLILIGEWKEDLPLKEFMDSSDMVYCLKFATKPIIRKQIEKSNYLRYRLIKDEMEGDYINIDFGSHIEFIRIKCIGEIPG